jgi:magnesium transporter
MRSVTAVQAELARGCQLFEKGAAWIVHALLDHLIDHYEPLMDEFDEQADEVESEAVTDPTRSALQRIFALKRSLMTLRRVAVHQREILLRLSRGEFALIPAPLLPFFRDVYDHFTRVADLCDGYRELVSGALDAYLMTTSNRMNEVMKVLTGIATVMLPLSFIASVYGMNFQFMPELRWRYGYFFAWGVMLTVAVGLIVYFRRRRWF